MLDIRFRGSIRYVVCSRPMAPADNSDGPDLSQAMAGGRFPSLLDSGIHWTRHVRPARAGFPASPPHLRLVQ